MRILADSHVLIWWLSNPSKLNPVVRAAIQDPNNDVLFSAASIWEIGLKTAKGHLRIPASFVPLLVSDGFAELSITVAHASAAMKLPPIHADPFDRMLIAQTLCEGLLLATRDRLIAQYDVPVIKA